MDKIERAYKWTAIAIVVPCLLVFLAMQVRWNTSSRRLEWRTLDGRCTRIGLYGTLVGLCLLTVEVITYHASHLRPYWAARHMEEGALIFWMVFTFGIVYLVCAGWPTTRARRALVDIGDNE